MADFEDVDFFSDATLLEDPYPYYEHLRSKCPVTPTAHHGVLAISGWKRPATSTATPTRSPRATP